MIRNWVVPYLKEEYEKDSCDCDLCILARKLIKNDFPAGNEAIRHVLGTRMLNPHGPFNLSCKLQAEALLSAGIDLNNLFKKVCRPKPEDMNDPNWAVNMIEWNKVPPRSWPLIQSALLFEFLAISLVEILSRLPKDAFDELTKEYWWSIDIVSGALVSPTSRERAENIWKQGREIRDIYINHDRVSRSYKFIIGELAHELAHVYRRDYTEGAENSYEVAEKGADDLAIEWGFGKEIQIMHAISDYIILRAEEQSEKSAKTGRNELCPCGSGKKYKKCCGR